MDYHHYSEETCDVGLEVEGVYFPVHQKAMLDLSPTFFSDVFSKGPTESLVYPVRNVASSIMRPIIQYAYSRQITITQRNVKDLLAAAEYLSVSDIVQLCKQFLEKQHCEEDRCETTELPTTQFCPDLLPWDSSLLYELDVFSPGALESNASPTNAFDPNSTPPTDEDRCETTELPTTQLCPDLIPWENSLLYELGVFSPGALETNASSLSAFEPSASPPSALEPNASPSSAFDPNATPPSVFDPNATPPTEEDHCETTELPTTQFCPDLLPCERSLLYELGVFPPGALEPSASPPGALEPSASPPSALEPTATPPTEEDRCETTELPTTQLCPDLLPWERSLLYELGLFPHDALEPNATPPSVFEPNAGPPSSFAPNILLPSAHAPTANPPNTYRPFAHAPSAAPSAYGQFVNAPYAQSPLFYCHRQKRFVSRPCHTPYLRLSVRSRNQA